MIVHFQGSANDKRTMNHVPRVGDTVYLGSVHRVTGVLWLLDAKEHEVIVTLADVE